jgi:general secretion pathway protein J
VSYAFEDDQLVRYTWSVLDRAQDSLPVRQTLSDDFTQMEIRYLEKNDWKTSWTGTTNDTLATALPGAAAAVLPRAIEITLEHKQYGKLVWLFRLPE